MANIYHTEDGSEMFDLIDDLDNADTISELVGKLKPILTEIAFFIGNSTDNAQLSMEKRGKKISNKILGIDPTNSINTVSGSLLRIMNDSENESDSETETDNCFSNDSDSFINSNKMEHSVIIRSECGKCTTVDCGCDADDLGTTENP